MILQFNIYDHKPKSKLKFKIFHIFLTAFSQFFFLTPSLNVYCFSLSMLPLTSSNTAAAVAEKGVSGESAYMTVSQYLRCLSNCFLSFWEEGCIGLYNPDNQDLQIKGCIFIKSCLLELFGTKWDTMLTGLKVQYKQCYISIVLAINLTKSAEIEILKWRLKPLTEWQTVGSETRSSEHLLWRSRRAARCLPALGFAPAAGSEWSSSLFWWPIS